MSEQTPDQIAVAEHVRRLREGAQQLRDGVIDHQRLVELVAHWIDAEALLWETADQYVRLVGALSVKSPTRGGDISFVIDEQGELSCRIDTSEHAQKIISEVGSSPNVPSIGSRDMGGDLR